MYSCQKYSENKKPENWALKIKSSLKCQKCPELRTLEWDTINPDCLIRISNVDTFDFLLNPLFFGYNTEK